MGQIVSQCKLYGPSLFLVQAHFGPTPSLQNPKVVWYTHTKLSFVLKQPQSKALVQVTNMTLSDTLSMSMPAH